MEPIFLTFAADGEFKQFEPSLSETFIYVVKGRIRLVLGNEQYIASEGNALYYDATDHHQILMHMMMKQNFTCRNRFLFIA